MAVNYSTGQGSTAVHSIPVKMHQKNVGAVTAQSFNRECQTDGEAGDEQVFKGLVTAGHSWDKPGEVVFKY